MQKYSPTSGMFGSAGKRLLAAPVLIAAVAAAGGCASLHHGGGTQRTTVASDPPGARLYVNGRPVGITPVDVVLRRRDRDVVLRFEKDGYATTKMSLDRSLSAWLWGDAAWLTAASVISTDGNYGDAWDDAHDFAWLSASTIGVDLLTGAAFKFSREVTAKLGMASAGTAATPAWREGIILPASHAPAADLSAGVSPRTVPAGDQP